MKKVIMTREKIYKAKEYVMPDGQETEVQEWAGFDDDEGVWNEYYRVGVIDTNDSEEKQHSDFTDNCTDHYSYLEAEEEYNKRKENL